MEELHSSIWDPARYSDGEQVRTLVGQFEDMMRRSEEAATDLSEEQVSEMLFRIGQAGEWLSCRHSNQHPPGIPSADWQDRM